MSQRLLLRVMLIATLALPSLAGALVIRGDYRWVQGPGCAEGWSAADFDDSDWKEAVYPNILMWQRNWPVDAEARPLWGDDFTSCVRRHFELAEAPAAATVKIWVDDDYELYINGEFIGRSDDGWAEMPGEIYDVARALREGDNVIALRLIDRVGEHHGALFVLDIPGEANEAPTWVSVTAPLRQTVTFGAIVLMTVLLVLCIRAFGRRLEPSLARAPTGVIGPVAIALAVAAQWCLQTQPLYQFVLGQPVTEWNWPPIAVAGIMLALLAVTLRGQPPSELATQSPRGTGWLLFAILLLAAYLRLVDIATVPPGFFQDEAINGLDSIHVFDVPSFEIWSDSIGGRPTLFLYAVGAVLQVFGINYVNLKVVPVAIGIASVAALYLVGRHAVGPRAALWAAFLFAISRWHIHFARMAWEVNCVPFFAAVGFALLLQGFTRERRSILMLTAAALVLATGMYTYAAYRAIGGVVVVFLIATVFAAERRVLLEKFWGLLVAGVAGAALIAPLVLFAINNPAMYWARYADVSLTTYMDYHGTLVPWLHQIAKALLALSHRGDLDVFPFLDPVSGVFLLLGVASAWPTPYRTGFRMVWCWFLTFAALSSLTKDSPHATRMLGMLPPVMLLAGYGAFRFFDILRRMAVPGFLRAAVVAFAAFISTGVNAYWYFGWQQQLPEIDLVMNEGARVLCTDLAERGGSIFWTDEAAYNCKPQCAFLFRGTGVASPTIITVDDLLNPEQIKAAPRPVTVIMNITTIERAGDKMKRDANGDPVLDLPARPTVMLTREGKPSYFIYRF